MTDKHVFVSYSHSDAHLATRAVTSLARARVPFFIDRVGLSPGDSLRTRLGDALDDASAVIALLTEHSIRSEWVRRELALLSERGTRIIPVRCDNSEWPTSIGLTIGDALYVDGRDPVGLAGRLPKVFHDRFPQHPSGNTELFFKLAARPRSPYAKFFPGTIQTALEEVAFGRISVVVPTDTSVNLGGKVTTSLLDFLNIDPAQLEHLRRPISSREVCDLGSMGFQDGQVHLMASTVFNPQGLLHSEDQWRAAAAVLGRAQELGCATVLVPPMGTGSYGWPRGAALQHWLYGAIRWDTSNPLATEEWTWPVICGPGAGGQRMFLRYLERLDANAMKRLENRQFELAVEYKGVTRAGTLGHHDTMLGSVVGQAWPELRGRRDIVAVHPADDLGQPSRELRYDLGTPLNKTVFADGDEIHIMDRNDLS